jgi:Flp pilus assembly protein TadD
VQRAESLVGLFYLLTLYCFIRGATSGRGRYWYGVAVLACLLGMASKEVMVSAPLIILLFDRTFLAGSFGEAWRRRYGVHLALAGTWLLLGWLVIVAGNRGGSAGFDAGGVSSWAYLCTQFGAIVRYLNLSVWPHRLLFDYGPDTAAVTSAIVPDAMLVGVLGLATIVALWRWPKMGFLGAWFFAILAPTSSIVPVATQIAAEHRMYLPLAAVVTGVIFGGYTACWVLACRGWLSPRMAGVFGICVATAVALTLGSLTDRRNADFHSDLSIWQDTVRKAPRSARAQNNLGTALVSHGRTDDAMFHYQKSLEIKPRYVDAHNNLAIVLADHGRIDEAVAQYRRALAIQPDSARAMCGLGEIMVARGQYGAAISQFRRALEIQPDLGTALNNLAWLRATAPEASLRNGKEAVELALRASRLSNTEQVSLLDTLAAAYAEAGLFSEAVTTAKKAVQLAARQNDQSQAKGIQARMRLYQSKVPYRESPTTK